MSGGPGLVDQDTCREQETVLVPDVRVSQSLRPLSGVVQDWRDAGIVDYRGLPMSWTVSVRKDSVMAV